MALACLLLPLPVRASDNVAAKRVEVRADQTATVVGSFDSLKGLLDELCAKADVELRSYDTADRAIGANYSERPLSQLLERLLTEENYLLGVRATEGVAGTVSVAWIRVTGAKRANGSDMTSGGIEVPARFGETGIELEKPDDTMRAQQAVAQRLLADETRVAQFLQLDASELAASLQQYLHIEVLLRRLRSEQRHPDVVDKLDAVIEQLGLLNAGQRPH